MDAEFTTAADLLAGFFGGWYAFADNAIPNAIVMLNGRMERVFLVHSSFTGTEPYLDQIHSALRANRIAICGNYTGIQPNAPREDLLQLAAMLDEAQPDGVVSFGGGSVIDCAKAAIVLHCLPGGIDDYFGTGLVSRQMAEGKAYLLPHLAIQAAASSAAHLTRYSNITNTATGQKKLIVDDAIVPGQAAFDYRTTLTAPRSLTIDGALDGFSHTLEVLYSLTNTALYERILPVAETAISLIVRHLPLALAQPQDLIHRTALALATDLGGMAIMLGGTNGAHLTSFSLVDLLPHGRACGMLNPYYTAFFTPAIEPALQPLARIFRQAGWIECNTDSLQGRDLGTAVAEGMLAFIASFGYPTTLNQVAGFTPDYILQALAAAKNPQLKMKLQNMPIPMNPETVDEWMGAILQAAASGDLSLIPDVGQN